MQITIFGASGSVGQFLIKEAEKRGHQIIAVSRRQGRIKETALTKERVIDYDDISSLASAFLGSQAAIISLGDYDVIGPTSNILTAMKFVGIKRVEILTGFGADTESLVQLGFGMQLVLKTMRVMMGAMFKNKIEQSKLVRESGLDFTNVQPPTLTFEKASKQYRHGNYKGKSIFGKVGRADLAAFMLDNIEQERYLRQAVYIQS